MRVFSILSLVVLFGITQTKIQAQNLLTHPNVSQKAKVMQEIGISHVYITYNRPAVKGREIWGALVPYDAIWRAGANENTTITLSDQAKINGETIYAGTYGLHIIPSEKDGWKVIFSKDNGAWGSYAYNKANDALRVNAKVSDASNTELLTYSFPVVSANSCDVSLRWEKKDIRFSIEFDVDEIVVANMQKELTSLPGFNAKGWQEIAAYCINNGIKDKDAEAWLDKSIAMSPSFTNLALKAQLQEKAGNTSNAKATMDKGLALANEAEINRYGYTLMNQGKKIEALEIFKMNTKRFPKSWNCYDSVAEGYLANGDKKNCIKNYKKALSMAPDNQKARIEGILKKI